MPSNLLEENTPISFDDKVSMSLFKWIIGGICVAAASIFGFLFVYTNSSVNKVEEKTKESIQLIESKYQIDHDKIIRLETKMESKK